MCLPEVHPHSYYIMCIYRQERYSSYDSGIGAMIEKGEATFEDLEGHIQTYGWPQPKSGQQEMYEVLLNNALQS